VLADVKVPPSVPPPKGHRRMGLRTLKTAAFDVDNSAFGTDPFAEARDRAGASKSESITYQ
jgi:hypothetical protein